MIIMLEVTLFEKESTQFRLFFIKKNYYITIIIYNLTVNVKSSLKFLRYGGIFFLHHRGSELTMLKERFKKVLINLGKKITKYLDISIV